MGWFKSAEEKAEILKKELIEKYGEENDRNEPVSAGLYLYTIQAGEFRQTKKMVLLK